MLGNPTKLLGNNSWNLPARPFHLPWPGFAGVRVREESFIISHHCPVVPVGAFSNTSVIHMTGSETLVDINYLRISWVFPTWVVKVKAGVLVHHP